MRVTDNPLLGFLRLRSIIAPQGPLPISRSTWFRGIAEGRYPKPVRLGPNTSAWREKDIRELIERLGASRTRRSARSATSSS